MGTATAAALFIGISLLDRRRAPLVVLGVQLLAAVVVTAVGQVEFASPFLISEWVALFTVASMLPRRTALVAGVVCTAAGVEIEVLLRSEPGSLVSLESLDGVVTAALAIAAGDAVRTRRIYVQVLEERARRAEDTREQEARARVAEERLRIARELLASYASADNQVQVTVRGKAQPLHAASELTAYRVVQESLTNAGKQGWSARRT